MMAELPLNFEKGNDNVLRNNAQIVLLQNHIVVLVLNWSLIIKLF